MRRETGLARNVALRGSLGVRRAGFTLIEVMIALALVLALAGLVWASLTPLRDRGAMDEACAMVADGVEQARSMAASTNQVMEVRASIAATTLEVQARSMAPAEQDEGASVRDGDERPWSVLVRIVGSFAREDPADSMDGGMGGAMGGAADEAERLPTLVDGEPEYVSIGVVLPDGSMVPGVPLRLKDSQGRWSVVRVGTWTTRIEVEAPVIGGSDEDLADEGTDQGASRRDADGDLTGVSEAEAGTE